jgi:hypothetical protein
MEEPFQLVGAVLLQQEGQPDLGSEVHPLDGLDAESGDTGRRKVDVFASDRPAITDAVSDTPGHRDVCLASEWHERHE